MNVFRPLWIHAVLVAMLSLVSWICAMDETGSPADTYLVWGATAIACGSLIARGLAPGVR